MSYLRTIYLLWIVGTIWFCQVSHEETAWLSSAIWAVILVSPVMFAVSGWAAATGKYRDISFIYPAVVIVVWFVGIPITAAMRFATEPQDNASDIFMHFFIRQFDWRTAIWVGGHLLFYVAGFVVGIVLLKQAFKKQRLACERPGEA